MKRELRLIALLVLGFTALKAQTNAPISTHAEWRYRYFRIDALPANCIYIDGQHITKGVDTMIDNKAYQIVYFRGKTTTNTCNFPLSSFMSPIGDTPQHLIRFENKKVFCIKYFGSNTNEFLLYDFGLNVGDTIPYFYPSHVITAIDSVFIDTKWHKKFNTGFFGPSGSLNVGLELIEGVGGSFGLIPPGQGTGSYPLQTLLCFKETDGQLFYPTPDCNYYIGQLGTSGIDKQHDLEHVTAFPNPSNDFVVIKLGETKFTTLTIFNALGQQVFTAHNLFENEIVLRPEIFHFQGFYSVLLSNAEENFFVRLQLCRM